MGAVLPKSSRPPRIAKPGTQPGGTPTSTWDDDGTPDDDLPDHDNHGHRDEEQDDEHGLPWWQRLGYGLADRFQNADLRRWVDALGDPLRRPAPKPFAVGIDAGPPAPSEVDLDIHIPASSYDWPAGPGPQANPVDPGPDATEWPPEWPPDPEPLHESHVPTAPPRRSTTVATTNIRDTGPSRGDYTHLIDESTPGTREEKYLAAAAAAAREAKVEAEGAEGIRRRARRIDGMKGMQDEHASLLTEARRRERNAERRLQIARQFRDDATSEQVTA